MPVLYLLLSAVLVVADQLVKLFVRTNIPLNTSVPFLPDVMNLTYIQNTGAAFSLFTGRTWLLAVLSAVVSVALCVLLLKRSLPHWTGMLSLALLLGGAVGNLIDRVLLGFVTDMFQTTFVNFAVFNVADIGVSLGGLLLCVSILCFHERDTQKEEQP